MKEYHKIQSVYKRDEKTKKFIIGDWSLPELDYLKKSVWSWDEKIDGTNIRVHWGNDEITFGGRTETAQIPATLIKELQKIFALDRLREVFSDGPVTFYGEGFGAKIQGGHEYLDHQSFMLFDVRIGDFWLERKDVEDIASKLGLYITHTVGSGTLLDAIEFVKSGFGSFQGTRQAEGLVLRPLVQLFNRKGERIIVKVKTRDFK